jgi:hypothetical protein
VVHVSGKFSLQSTRLLCCNHAPEMLFVKNVMSDFFSKGESVKIDVGVQDVFVDNDIVTVTAEFPKRAEGVVVCFQARDGEDFESQVRFSNEVDVNGDTFAEGKRIS